MRVGALLLSSKLINHGKRGRALQVLIFHLGGGLGEEERLGAAAQGSLPIPYPHAGPGMRLERLKR